MALKFWNKQLLPVPLANRILFILVLLTVFCVPVLPSTLHLNTYSILITSIILIGTQLVSWNRMVALSNACLAITLVWIGEILDLNILRDISKIINAILFILIVIDLIRQINKAKIISLRLLIVAINSYLMIGLVFSIGIAFLMSFNHGSFSFSKSIVTLDPTESQFGRYIYYAFTTLTTAGYGDIVPLTPLARSMSILISVTGQLYIAIVIAMLVGKYISQKNRIDL